jgi:Ca-activated chloride channel family protein
MKFVKSLLLTAMILFVFSGAFAQDDVITVETNLVTVNVSITDKNGNFVKGLKRENFEIFDNNVKQEIEQFSAEQSAVAFGIVYDLHPTTSERSANVLGALRQFTKELKPNDYFFVSVFNENGSLTTDFVPTNEQIDKFLAGRESNTPNSLYDVIFEAADKIRERKDAKQVLLVLTDGEDHASHHSLKELRLRLRSVNLPVYTVAFHDENRQIWGYSDIHRNEGRQVLGVGESNQLNTAALAEISKTSGGQTFERLIQNRFYLYGIFKKVAAEIENQYVLGFYPDKLDGRWHKLKVSVKTEGGKKVRLSSRRGYQSPLINAKAN